MVVFAKKNPWNLGIAILLLIVALTLVGCGGGTTPGPGNLKLTINYVMNQYYYYTSSDSTTTDSIYHSITAIGPKGATFSVKDLNINNSYTLNQTGLAPGNWTITVAAKTPYNLSYGQISIPVTIIADQTNTTAVKMQYDYPD